MQFTPQLQWPHPTIAALAGRVNMPPRLAAIYAVVVAPFLWFTLPLSGGCADMPTVWLPWCAADARLGPFVCRECLPSV